MTVEQCRNTGAFLKPCDMRSALAVACLTSCALAVTRQVESATLAPVRVVLGKHQSCCRCYV